jgi:hypothetical protein
MTLIKPIEEIPIEILTSIFNETTNSYKFYWFLSILDILEPKDINEIPIQEICEKMLESVLYPLNVFKLSFGKQDGFKKIVDILCLSDTLNISNFNSNPTIYFRETIANNITLRSEIKNLSRWVPYRFIRPFFKNQLIGVPDHTVNNKIIELSNQYSKEKPNLIPYYFVGDNIVFTTYWKNYLKKNIGMIRGFTIWKLASFVQKHNPNVTNIATKLFKPEKRNLNINIKSWEYYINQKKSIQCIYSNELIHSNFSLDHFVPWSYAVHDLNWNIIPTSKNVNSSKSDNLPSLERYLSGFIAMQRDFFSNLYESEFPLKKRILEHYCVLFNDSLFNISKISHEKFEEKLEETILPMIQIASNMGFNSDWIYQKKINSK